MTREEVYKKCIIEETTIKPGVTVSKILLPPEAINAIIDCAKEEMRKELCK